MATRITSATFTRELTEEDKVAPQMRGIVESVIEAHGVGVAVTTEQVTAAMEGNITTRQPLDRIFAYYIPKLEEAGLITVERAVVVKKEKAPKAPKAAKAGDTSNEGLDDDLDEDEDLDDDGEDADAA